MSNAKKVTVPAIRAMKGVTRIGMLAAYDYPSAKIVDAAGADIILVGDSLGMVILGYPDTLSVTVGDMLHHTRAVVRGTQRSLVVGDMPYLSYHISVEESVRNAGEFIRAGAHAVKVEGAKRQRIATIEAILSAEIPVMGHIGLTPQSVNALGGFKLQGKNADDVRRLVDEAVALDGAGCFSIVLECVPAEVAAIITERVSCPTICIGARPPRPLRRPHPEVRPPLRHAGRGCQGRHRSLPRRCPRGTLPERRRVVPLRQRGRRAETAVRHAR
jgi:3-methyl-2-oxobutanoate hydroxymethyltransferase